MIGELRRHYRTVWRLSVPRSLQERYVAVNAAIDELTSVPTKVKPEEIKLAKQVIENFEGALNLEEYRDEYQEELQRIIDAKIAGEEVVATIEETPPKVVNLMDALRQSLDRVSTGKKKTAKVVDDTPAVKAPAKKRAAR